MIISSLKTENFRNLSGIDLTFCNGVNVIFGENGQGKTNLLENIWLFTGAKSFRGAKEGELLNLNKKYWKSSIEFFAYNRNFKIKLSGGEKKEIFVNDVSYQSFSNISGNFLCLIFSPTHLSLVKGSPQERRHSLDTVISQVKPRYSAILNEYNKILNQRNTLLKDSCNMPELLDTLPIWDKALISRGALISKTRKTYLEKLLPKAKEIYSGISRGKEELDLNFVGICDENELENALKEALSDDIKSGFTSCGPHRDDVEIKLSDLSAKAFASQGQQRSIVLALKLGESSLIEEVTGEMPIILLDDVMSELDESRREYLLHNLKDKQIFITCCDKHQIASAEALFECTEGKIVPSLRK